ncbi:MAG TPA: hypothetical protein DEP84_10740, partial [Chloroflexi bacterium]|nr:hypothetical protein [Chloroflexota bacterium]
MIDPASEIPPCKYHTINEAVVAACDGLDGVVDGVVGDPRQCHFDPETITCPKDVPPDCSCLTEREAEAVRQIYAGPHNSAGEQVWYGLEPGSEPQWTGLASPPPPFPIAVDFYKYFVFQDPTWDWRTLNYDTDIATAKAKFGDIRYCPSFS